MPFKGCALAKFKLGEVHGNKDCSVSLSNPLHEKIFESGLSLGEEEGRKEEQGKKIEKIGEKKNP